MDFDDIRAPRRQRCCVEGCTDKTSKRHRFPKNNPDICDIWLERIKPPNYENLSRDQIYKSYLVCNAHFSEESRVPGTRRGLICGAVPSLKIPGFGRHPMKQEMTVKESLAIDETIDEDLTTIDDGLGDLGQLTSQQSEDESSKSVPSELKKVTLSEDDLKQFPEVKNEIKYTRDIKMCRTCADTIISSYSIHSNISNSVSTIRDMILLLVPQMQNLLHEDDVICENCHELLMRCATFIEKCLHVEADRTNHIASEDYFHMKNTTCDDTSSVAVAHNLFSDDISSHNQDMDLYNEPDVYDDKSSLLIKDFKPDTFDQVMDTNDHQNNHDSDISQICLVKELPKSILNHNKLISASQLTSEQLNEFTRILASNDVITLQCSQDSEQKTDRKRIILVGSTFKCKYCFKYFETKGRYNCHLRIHKRAEQRRAERNKLKKRKKEEMKADDQIVSTKKKNQSTGKVDLVCKTCLETCSSKDELEVHVKLHPPFICEKCGKGFSSSFQLKTHTVVHNDPNSYICEVCGKGCKTQTYFRVHKMLHENKTYLCYKCSKVFKTSLNLKKHLKYTHSEGLTRLWSCKECDKVFKVPGGLKAHYRLMHLKDDTLKCEVCGQGFCRIDYLKRHMRRHTIYERKRQRYPAVKGVDQIYQCQICTKVLKSMHNLKLHIRSHGSLSRFGCKYCNMTFKIKYQRNRHERLHEKSELKYRCGICWKRFEFQEELDQHSLAHNNLKHKCELCDQSFARKHLLDDHFVKIHVDNEDVEEEARALFTAGLGVLN